MKKIKLTETELTRLIEKVIKEQTLPPHIKKGSKEHAEWVRSQQGDGSDEILESLLSVSQRLSRFVEDVRGGGIGETEDLRDIQKDMEYQIIQYIKWLDSTLIGTTEVRTNKSTYKKHR